ncbi:alkaline phosphatase, partial [Acinetobacter sp. LH3_13]
MGITTMTAARIYSVGEDGELTMDKLPETAFVHTFSNDAQVTDSAPSMAAYMTGVKMNNEVISMTPDT